MVLEFSKQFLIDGLAGIYSSISKLLKNVVETRSPLTRSSLCGERAVINHESYSTVVHVRTEGVNSLNNRLVDNLRVRVSSLKENITLCHHGSNVNSSSERIHGDLLLITFSANLLSNLPTVSSINLSNGELLDTVSVHDNSTDLVSGRNLVVNFLKDLLGRLVGCRVSLLEDYLVICRKSIVNSLDSLSRDGLYNISSDGLTGLGESLLGCHSLAHVTTEERLNNSVNCSEKNSTLSVDIRAVFGTKSSLEHERRSKSNSPSKSKVSSLSRNILVYSEGSIDSSSVSLLTLFVETTYGRSHSLGAYSDHIHLSGERLVDGVKVSKKESVGKSKSSTGLHSSEYFLVQFSLCSIRNKKDDKVGLANYLEHLSKGSLVLGETAFNSLRVGSRSLTKTNGYLNISSNLVKGVTNVLCLSRSLGSPSDNSNLLNSLESLGEKGEEITSSLDDSLGGLSESNLYRLENIGGECIKRSRCGCNSTGCESSNGRSKDGSESKRELHFSKN
mmetsp:Transcript_25377/g.37605  ORF Transcript_25377/g.37605 Transcript_25377/m.37605 type:complete len:504 (-) Transcript_25377:19-1530(-)